MKNSHPSSLSGHWLGLGRFDHLFITLAQEKTDLLHAEKQVQSCLHANSHWSCFGRVLEASWDLNTGIWPKDQGVLIGVCGIKLAHQLRDALPGLDSVGTAVKQKLAGLPGHWLVTSTTGWEDMALIYWANDFESLSTAIGKVRSMEIAEIGLSGTVNGVHAVLTTCTVPGVELPAGSFSPNSTEPPEFHREAWLEQVSQRVGVGLDQALSWALRFELRPGHYDAFNQEIKTLAEASGFKGDQLSYAHVLGQYDLRVQSLTSTHGDWLNFLGRVALPVAARPKSLVRAMETHLHIPIAGFSEGSGAKDVSPVSSPEYSSDTLTSIKEACSRSGIAPHTLEMLESTHSRLIALQEDDLQHGTFQAIETLFKGLSGGLAQNEGKPSKLHQSLPHWLYLVERSLSDRYRGTYPLGEAVIPRLGTYQASHHGFLAAVDKVAQTAFNEARTLLNTLVDRGEGTAMPEVAVCTFIGSSPSPNAQTFNICMRSGFVELPSIMVFRMSELWILLHEVGHVFGDTATEHFQIVFRGHIGEAMKVELQEILADAFACSLSTQGDVEAFGQLRLKTHADYLPNFDKYASSNSFILQVRLLAVHGLLSGKVSRSKDASELFKEFKEKAEQTIERTLKNKGLEGDALAEETEQARKAIGPVFEAVWSLAQSYHDTTSKARSLIETLQKLKECQHPILDRARAIIRHETCDMADGFRFIEEMVGNPVHSGG